MVRFTRIGGSLAIVLVAYCAYALVAVPLIDPPADRHRSEALTEEELEHWAEESRERWRREFSGLFPPDSWELKDPRVLEIDQVKLLLQDYTRLEDGTKVEIRPCTMIFVPDTPADDAEQRRRRSVVLEAPHGAVLEFDKPFDLRRAKIGRLLGGQLKGRITIRSGGKSPGPDDDLEVVTRDVSLSEEEIRTEHEVDFRLGSSYGRGRRMWIKLLPGPKEEAAKKHGPNVEGIEFIEIEKLDRVHLQLDDQGIVPNVPAKATGRQGPGKSEAASDLPIEITCRGPFRFDPIQQVATFKDQVDVIRLHREGPSDQLNNCETLSIHFARPRDALATRADAESGPSDAKRQWELHPRRITARGTPVVLRAPSEEIDARGEQLTYDFESGWIVLEGTQEVFLKQGANEIHGRRLEYQMAENGRLGQAKAEGPGRLRAQLGDGGEQQLSARWGELLQLRNYQGQPVISLTGDAELDFGQLGKLTAPQIHLYLFELPPEKPGEQVRVRPDRMVALTHPADAAAQSDEETISDETGPRRAVQLHSPQLTAAVEQLGVWFERPSASADGDGRSALQHEPRRTPGRPPTGPAGRLERSDASLLSAGGQGTGDRPDNHFTIEGKLLRARVLVPDDVSARGETSELAELTIEGNVELVETRCAQPDELPVVVRGDLIHVTSASRPSRRVTVAGNPPRFEGRGLVLSGAESDRSSIELDGQTNKLRIDKPGWMELPLERDLEGRPLPRPGRLHIVWQKRMTFDGRTVRFEGAVVATNRHPEGETELFAEALDVILVRRILFTNLGRQPDQPDLNRIICYGGVFIENRSWDQRGQLSLDRMQLPNLDIDLTSGQSAAGGPGRLTSVHRGAPGLLASRANDRPNAQTPDSSQADDDQLRYLNVRYQGSIEGNVRNREMTFYDRVRTVSGPVDSWDATLDPDDPEALGPRGFIVSCDRLSVADMPQPLGGRAMELAASGNVVAEGRTFTARAPLVTYSDAKQLLILDGQGRAAQLYHQNQVGAPVRQVSAQKILYWPFTGDIVLGDVSLMKSN